MIGPIATYFILGTFWSWWLEKFTTQELEHPYNQPWSNYERGYHILLFGYTFGVFIYNLLREINNNKPK